MRDTRWLNARVDHAGDCGTLLGQTGLLIPYARPQFH